MRASEKTVSSFLLSSMLRPDFSFHQQALNKLRKHNDIRFEIKKLEKTSDKAFLLIQVLTNLRTREQALLTTNTGCLRRNIIEYTRLQKSRQPTPPRGFWDIPPYISNSKRQVNYGIIYHNLHSFVFKVVVEVAVVKKLGTQVKHGLEL